MFIPQLRWLRLLPRLHAAVCHLQEHWPHRHRHVPAVPAPHNCRDLAQQPRPRSVHHYRDGMALCQVPGSRRRRRWPRLPIGAHTEQGDGRPDIPRHLPQGRYAPPERPALHLDALGARHLPPAGDRRDARQHVCHGQEGLQHDLQHPRQGDELGGRRRRRPGDGAARLQGSQKGRRQVGPHGQRAQPIRRIRHCRGT